MFLLVSGGHVGAHPDGHQHGVTINISINLGKMLLRISSIRKIAVTWILARIFAYLSSFFSQILDFVYWTVLIFSLIYSEWRGTENQQYHFNTIIYFPYLCKCFQFANSFITNLLAEGVVHFWQTFLPNSLEACSEPQYSDIRLQMPHPHPTQ